MPSAFWGLHGSPGGMIAKMPRFGLTAVQYSKGQRVEAVQETLPIIPGGLILLHM